MPTWGYEVTLQFIVLPVLTGRNATIKQATPLAKKKNTRGLLRPNLLIMG